MQTNKFLSRFAAIGMRLAIFASMLLTALITSVTPAAAVAVTFDLYAVSGSTTLASQVVPVWGYNSTNAPVTQPGGPVLIVNQGDVVTINLHNSLTFATGLLFQGQALTPDTVGVSSGGTKSYVFTATNPGTYLYEAGLLPGAQYQTAMGLYGALIVRPATAGQAYDDASTAFDNEAVLVLSEIDPALNGSPNPSTFDMRNYNPRYFLINGKAYPNTDGIPTAAGNRVLLRYLNAGIKIHSMALLGMHQTVIAYDGSPLTFSHRMVAESFGSGQTADTIATIPASATAGSRFAIYDGNLMLRNSNTAGFGGMLTFLSLTPAGPGGDTTGPATSAVTLTPNAGAIDVSATVSDAAAGNSNIAAAEYFIDTVGADGTGTAMSGAFTSPAEVVTGTISAATVAGLSTGDHLVYVHGQDAAGNWGATNFAVLHIDTSGPTTSALVLSPNPTNGTANVALSATGNDSASGNSNISAAEYFINATGANGSGAAMTVNVAAPVSGLAATIPAATVAALTEGARPVFVHSQDATGNWGAFAQINLNVDKTAPTTSGVSAAPNPNNGTLPINQDTLAVRVSATLSDPLSGGIQSNISAAEGFIDTVGANGSGFVFAANDGAFNSSSEAVSSDIPLATIIQLNNGNHTIYVHGRDAAGNWGPTSTTVLLIDKVGPLVTGVSATPNPTNGAATVTLSASATDVGTGVVAAEWFTGADPGAGNGNAMTVSGTGPWSLSATIDVSNWNEGSYTLRVRARDAVGNWRSPVSTVLVVTRPIYFSTLGNTNPPGVGGSADDADIYFWSGTAFSRSIDVSTAPYSLPNGANVDGFDRIDATHFYVSFSNVNTNVPGLGPVQDEDVLYYNNGVWSVYFDGTAHGLGTSGNLDIDAISIVGGTLYFSTTGNTNPPGVAGTADDADIYSWNGSSYARVWDATANGLPGAANVDGYVRVDATHFYLSFSTPTALPPLGTVQDENVVYFNAGTWSVYFNGTAHGLGTSGNLDIDAFDLP